MNIHRIMGTRATLLRGWEPLGTEVRSQWESTELALDDSFLRLLGTVVQRATMTATMRKLQIRGTRFAIAAEEQRLPFPWATPHARHAVYGPTGTHPYPGICAAFI
jgi:hypothetical protein